ncbi:MAG: hypothetical protein QOF30_2509 [Acidimicrobiaceae bacterium]|jgi:hypothetical protein|nr:hypothetical protein [Acidimicrobiaceae bacterium]
MMGLGAAEAIASSEAGTVIARFAKAAYVKFPGGVVALTSPSVPIGPLHLRSLFEFSHLAPGDRLVVPDDWRQVAAIWQPELPDRRFVQLPLLAAAASPSALLTEALVDRWQIAARQTSLEAVCRVLGGLGPGLTPSGDDALAGMLLAARVRWPEAQARLVALAGAVDTHEIARAFLVWAARGQSVAPVHRLLAGDPTAATDLMMFGHTSGADLALGLWHGFTCVWWS